MTLHEKAFFFNTVQFFYYIANAIVISEPIFAGAYFQPDFAAIGLKKFPAQYFLFKAKLKQKKLHVILKQYLVTATWEIKIS